MSLPDTFEDTVRDNLEQQLTSHDEALRTGVLERAELLLSGEVKGGS